jgi:multiple sugar transport system substrate-binding protein
MLRRYRLRTLAAASSAALLLLGALSACGRADKGGGDATNGAGKTINMLVGVNNAFPDQQRKWFTDVSDAFKKQTGATVHFETFASAIE